MIPFPSEMFVALFPDVMHRLRKHHIADQRCRQPPEVTIPVVKIK